MEDKLEKTSEQYKEELIKRSTTGFLLKYWYARYNNFKISSGDWLPNNGDRLFDNGTHLDDTIVKIPDTIYSRETGSDKFHIWTEKEFKNILDKKAHWKRKKEAKAKRQKRQNNYKR